MLQSGIMGMMNRMRSSLKALALALVLSLPLAGCGGTNHSWHQKLTVIVNTPQGEKTGSAVTRVSHRVGRQWGTGADTVLVGGYAGEATVVDLGDGKYLFAVLSSEGQSNTEYLAELVFQQSLKIDSKLEEISRLNQKYSEIEKLRVVEQVPRQYYPLLVTFTDINDPKSVKEVKPDSMADSVGAGSAVTFHDPHRNVVYMEMGNAG